MLTLSGFSLGYGEAITLVSAVLYALHIVGLGAWSTPRDAVGMSILQIMVITAVCFVATVPDGIVLPSTGRDWLSVVYMALIAGALAMLGQTWAQAHLPPTRTAIIMSMEPVFAASFAVWLGGEGVTSAAGRRRPDGADRDARGGARAAAPGRGRGLAHRRLTGKRPGAATAHPLRLRP